MACIPGIAVLFQTLSFDLQQRLSDEEGTNMVRPSPHLSSDLFLQYSEVVASFLWPPSMPAAHPLPRPQGHGEPRL